MKNTGFALALLSILFVCLIVLKPPEITQAQVPFQWSTPEQIPEYNDLRKPPLMIADRNGTVHAFNVETLDGNMFAIMYRHWSLDQGWSSPVDILLPTFIGGAPKLLDVILGEHEYFHLLYFAGTLQAGELYYSSAQVREADHSTSWSDPVPITSEAGPLPSAQIIELGSDRLGVVFAGQRYGSGLYEIHSDDRGVSWSSASLVKRSSIEDLNPAEIRLALDSEGRLHAVWHLVNVSGLPEETWYARLRHDLSTWAFLKKLSQKDNEQEFNGWPSIVLVEDEVLVVFYDGFPPTRYFRSSKDEGRTWSPPVRPFPHQGGYGHSILIKDSQGTVHIVLGNRLQNPEIYGMWYSRLLGDAWLPLLPIISGPGINGFAPTHPEATIVHGNVLLAAWSNDVSLENRSAAWYSYVFLDAPQLSKEPRSVHTVSAETEEPGRLDASVIVTQIVPSNDATVPAASFSLRPGPEGRNPGQIILFGVVPVLVIVLIALYLRIRQHRIG